MSAVQLYHSTQLQRYISCFSLACSTPLSCTQPSIAELLSSTNVHASSLPPVADMLLPTYVQSCMQRCVVVASRWFTYVGAQFWECVCTQSDEMGLTCCCCWTGCPLPRPQACCWAELHCALYVTRGCGCRHQVAAQQHTHHFVGCSVCVHVAV